MKYELPNYQELYEESGEKIEVLLRRLREQREQLRDQFAMAALSLYSHDGNYSPRIMAESAYKIADAMLEERKR
jgi:hypothetical protein